MLVPQIGHPIPEEWHYMLDQSTDNIFHPQEIVGYETSDGSYVFAQVLYAVPPEEDDEEEEDEDDDESSQGQNPLQWNLLIRDTLVHRPLSLIRRLSLIGRFGIKPSFYILVNVPARVHYRIECTRNASRANRARGAAECSIMHRDAFRVHSIR